MLKSILALILLFPSVTLALVRGEIVTADVLNVADKQMIVSRGGSDALVRGEYVRVMQDGRYKGRAIAIQVLPYVSQWALYYVYEPIGYGSPVELKKSSPHPIIEEVRATMNLSAMDKARLQAYAPKVPGRPVVREDIDPEQEKLDQQLALAERYAGDETGEQAAAKQARESLSENLDELVEENRPLFTGWEAKVGLSPASFRRVGSERDISMRGEIRTSRLRELTANYQVDSRRYRDQLSGEGFDYTQQKGELTIDIIRLHDHLSLFSYASYERRKQGQAYPLRAHVNAGPIGVKYDFLGVKTPWVYLDLSYIPTFDYQKSDFPLTASTFETRSDVGLRHSFRLRGALEHFDKKLMTKFEVNLRPLQETESLGIDTTQTHFSWMLSGEWNLGEYFSVSYVNEFSREPRRRQLQGISATDMVHTFFINFNSML